jgi:drug/metabolite transporter (DMT)-like permease
LCCPLILPRRQVGLRWLVGLAVMIAGELASAWSVSHLTLSVVEPLLTTSLLFALALAVPLSGQRLGATELLGVLILGSGVAALSVARTSAAPAESFVSPSGWFAAVAVLWLMESAFNAAPLHASLPAISAAEPAAGILLGILFFGDSIRTSPAMIAVQAAVVPCATLSRC